jgi:hypothetical protein
VTGETKSNALQHAKIMGLLYAVLILFMVLLMFSSAYIVLNTPDVRLRAFTLAWIASLMIGLVCLQMLKCMYHSGINPLTLSLFGFLNVVFVGLQLAVFADILVSDIADTPILMVVLFLTFAIFGTVFLTGWMIWSWMKSRGNR